MDINLESLDLNLVLSIPEKWLLATVPNQENFLTLVQWGTGAYRIKEEKRDCNILAICQGRSHLQSNTLMWSWHKIG